VSFKEVLLHNQALNPFKGFQQRSDFYSTYRSFIMSVENLTSESSIAKPASHLKMK